ncbi:MAG: orotidine-5'-phosphate decarboxylase [Clostridiales bacterium]|nr:MAG: orotidine-5'-phosphate decarboxylase [Clostridiales bacterium]
MISELIEKIAQKQNPTTLGLDPIVDYLPEKMVEGNNPEAAARAVYKFNKELMDALCDIIPCVKIQMAYYELLGLPGMEVFYKTINYAKEKGFYIIIDGKRNDIGSTAECYAKAYLENTAADSITVNAYLGFDGVRPFIKKNKSIFALVKTSNKSSGDLQDKLLDDGKRVYELMGDMIEDWGETSRGKYGYSEIGAVVGATYPEQLEYLRNRMPHTFFLVPGYGAQGGTAKDVAGAFLYGVGAVINSSRGLMCAYKKHGLPAEKFAEAAVAEAILMRDEINSFI